MRMSDTLRRAHYLPVPIRLHTRPSRPSDPASPCALSRSGESPPPPPHRQPPHGAAAPVFQRPSSTAGSRAGWRGALGCPGEAVCVCTACFAGEAGAGGSLLALSGGWGGGAVATPGCAGGRGIGGLWEALKREEGLLAWLVVCKCLASARVRAWVRALW
jgi:hypothetical protein